VSKGTQQAHDTVDFLRRRCKAKIDADDMVGQIDTRFHASRGTLLVELDNATRDVVSTFDSSAEARAISDGVQQSIFQTAALEFGAAGVGALQVVFMIDWTAILGASTLAVRVVAAARNRACAATPSRRRRRRASSPIAFSLSLSPSLARPKVVGLYALPYRRRRLRQDFRAHVDGLRVQLDAALDVHLEKELDSQLERTRDAISPYSRFVRIERDKLSETSAGLADIQRRLARLDKTIDEVL
jgi:hypothetical protein